jgi:hypothetical protein
MAKQKAHKDAKAKAAEAKKLLATIHKKEMKAKQQEKLILTAKAKVAKAYSRAEDLHLKLEEAIRASTGVEEKSSPSFDMVHSHKKSKGSVGSFTLPGHFPSDTLTLSGSSKSDSFSEGVLTIGSNINNEDKVEEVVEVVGSVGSCTVSPVAQSHQYLSPQRKGTTVNKRVSAQLPRYFTSDLQ